ATVSETENPPEATVSETENPPVATVSETENPPVATVSETTGSSEATRPRGPKAKKRQRNSVQQRVASKMKQKKKYECPECCMRVRQNNFEYSKVLKRRMREGTEEVLICWVPCKTCGTKWKDSWEPSSLLEE
ncbi:hypothetical protein PO909_002128, partial [Leuciscus waleckii]